MTAADPQPRLTPRQRAVLDCIRDHVATHGYPPTVREIGDTVGLVSTSSVHHQLRQLVRKGLIERCGAVSRGIAVAEPDTAGAELSVPDATNATDEPANRRRLAAVLRIVTDHRKQLTWADNITDPTYRVMADWARALLDAIERAAGGGS